MMGVSQQWNIEHSVGGAGAFHARDPEPRRSAVFHSVEHTTLVLGSSQSIETVDQAVAAALQVEVVPRRSGGGAVLLVPGEFVWLDLVVPAGDPLWSDDVARSMHWVGSLWQRALAEVGVESGLHTGPMRSSVWSRQVCFHGLGPGEVVVGDAKVVGVSQRRTRQWARFQTMCHLRWRPELVTALVAPPRPSVSEVAPCAATVPATVAALVAALTAALP